MSQFYEDISRASVEAGNKELQVGKGGAVVAEKVRETNEIIGEPPGDDLEPEILEVADPTPSAVVPVPTGFVQGRVTRFLQRVLEGVPRPPAERPTELLERLDGLEVQLAALEEEVAKRLEEGEGRTLHLVEKRLGVLQDEIGDVARRAAGEQVADEMRALRQRTTVVGAFAVGLAAAALMTALDVI